MLPLFRGALDYPKVDIKITYMNINNIQCLKNYLSPASERPNLWCAKGYRFTVKNQPLASSRPNKDMILPILYKPQVSLSLNKEDSYQLLGNQEPLERGLGDEAFTTA
jgi:hypothetical protein